MKTKPIRIRSTHYKGPQPGQIATVLGIKQIDRGDGHWTDCYVAQFDNGEFWYCPVMAVKDYERME